MEVKCKTQRLRNIYNSTFQGKKDPTKTSPGFAHFPLSSSVDGEIDGNGRIVTRNSLKLQFLVFMGFFNKLLHRGWRRGK